MRKTINWLLLLFLVFTIFLSLNRHNKSGIQNYHSEIWADKAGYYIYLPAFFIYNFDTKNMPTDIDKKTGNGFFIDHNKIITKYTYGVSLMQAPYFIVCHSLSKFFGFNPDGFSIQYHKTINISAVLYSFFSLIILYFFLVRYLSKKTTIITLIFLYLGTNIFYYSIFDTGMSHIYSLFLFTCYLYLSTFIAEEGRKVHYFLFGLVIGLILVVRPINVLFLPVYLMFNSINASNIKNNISNYLLTFFVSFLVILPQLIYWKYAFGNYFQYAYAGESFSNILQPKLFHLWFSTNNGLFIYNPIMVFILISITYYFAESPKNSIIIGIYFLLLSYIFSSWHSWHYGCSFGSRPYVEYYSLFALPFGFFIQKLYAKSNAKTIVLFFIIICIIYNQKLIFSYDGCWYGDSWDWTELFKLVFGPTK
jgi:hypothetical protein